MSSTPPITLPALTAGANRVNAVALDAQIRQLVVAINATIAAVARMRDARNELGDGVVRWRMFSESARTHLQVIASLVQAVREVTRQSFPRPLGSHPWPGIYRTAALLRHDVLGGAPTPPGASQQIVVPGNPYNLYRLVFRFRSVMELVWVSFPEANLHPLGKYGPYPPPWPPVPGLPGSVDSDGTVFFSKDYALEAVPNGFDYCKLQITPGPDNPVGGNPRIYILNGQEGYNGSPFARWGAEVQVTSSPDPYATNGSNIIVGTGSTFLADFKVGDRVMLRGPVILPSTEPYWIGGEVTEVIDDTHLRLDYIGPLPTPTISGPLFNTGFTGATTCIPIDVTFEAFAFGGDTLQFLYNSIDGQSSVTTRTDFPADDDERFPYLARYRDAAGVQFDLMALHPIDANDMDGYLTTEVGAILDTEGPGGFLEITP